MSQEDSKRKEENSNLDVVYYLIKKLESRYNSILKFNDLLDSFDTRENFFNLRKDLKLLFNDLSEDFKQGIFAIKALLNQNKKILEEIKLQEIKNKNTLDELNNYITENKNLKKQIIDNKSKYTFNKNNIDSDDDSDDSDESEESIKEKKKIIEKEKENNINNIEQKKNKYEMENLSNVKNIMANMKKNKMKFKMAIDQHLANIQNIDDN